jgi:SAM-dependent methyltransferase
MSGFSPDWLDLREAIDHRSRNRALALALARYFDGWRPLRVVDLGCGTGSNLRATAPLLGPEQHWTLVDHDQALLDAAAVRLTAWADNSEDADGALSLRKGHHRINVALRRADLAGDLAAALDPAPHLVTAAALFDLVSADFIAKFAAAVAARNCAFYAVLTYDGDQRWQPEHEADAAMSAAFHAHQGRDKGFGAAAGPSAPDLLSDAFSAARYTVSEADSAWRLGPPEADLIDTLADGFAAAVKETGRLAAGRLASWRGLRRTAAVVGHADTLALPPMR